MADTCTVLVDTLPFACSKSLFSEGLQEATLAGRAFLDRQVKKGKEKKGSTYGGLIYDPTDPLGGPIAAINLGGSDTSRFVNAAGKVDWAQTHPDVNFDDAFKTMPWLIGVGQFMWGHATMCCGFPAAGSGLSAKGDLRIMNVMIEVLADTIRPEMSKGLKELRSGGMKWLDNEPRTEYTVMARICEGWPTIMVD